MLDRDDPRLTAYALGELDESERQSIESELGKRPELREEVEATRRTSSLLTEHLGAEPYPQLTGEQREAIRRESQTAACVTPDPVEVKRRRRRRFLLASLTVAATLLIAVLFVSGQLPFADVAQRVDSPTLTVVPSREGEKADVSVGSNLDLRYVEESEMEESRGYMSLLPSETAPSADDDYSFDAAIPEIHDPVAELADMSASEIRTIDARNGDSSGVSATPAGASSLDETAVPGTRTSPESHRPDYDIAGMQGGYGDDYGRDGAGGRGGLLGGGMGGGQSGGEQGQDFGVHPPKSPSSGPARPETASEMAVLSGRLPSERGLREDDLIEEKARVRSGQGHGAPADSPSRNALDRYEHFSNSSGLGSVSRGAGARSGDGYDGEDGIARGGSRERTVRRPQSSRTSADDGRPELLAAAQLELVKERASFDESRARLEAEKENLRGKLSKPDNPSKSADQKKKSQETRTWRRAKATPNASRLMIGDRDDLPLEGMQVNVMVDGFRARVLLDLYYHNDRGQQLEGSFKLRLPNEASLYYFAFGQTTFEYRPMVDSLATRGFLSAEMVRASGTGPKEIFKARSETWRDVKEARVVPREKAAHAYSEVVRRRVDPALVEWSGAGVFNAKVFPLMPNKLHRIVVGYDVNLRQDGDDLVYSLDLPEDLSQCMVDLDISALPGASAEVTPAARPFVSGGRAFYHFDDPADKSIDVRFNEAGTVLLTGNDESTNEYFTTRITLSDDLVGQASSLSDEERDLAGKMPTPRASSARAIFLLDTSLSSNPDKFNVWLKMLETILEKNRDSIQQFAVLFFNVESHWSQAGYVRNTSKNVRKVLNYASTLSLEGATDLRQALAEANKPEWSRGDEKTPTPDLFLLSDGAATWGETDINAIARTLKSGTSGSLFAYKTGLTGTAIGALEHLSRETGGAVFSVAGEQEVGSASTAHRTRPWRLLNVAVDDASDVLVAGRPRFVYPGQSLLVVGRGKPQTEVHLHLRRGDEDKALTIPFDRIVKSELAARTYGQVAVGQLEDLASATEDVSVAYARHFRVTGRTCSLLMLESEADYQRFNIKPEDDQFVVKSSPADHLIRRKFDEMSQKLDDPKEALKAWLAKMEALPGFQFKVPTALGLVVDRLPREAFDVEVPRLVCKQRDCEDLPKKFFQQLEDGNLEYDVVTEEAERRHDKHGGPDALKALSSLIERNPGDTVLARDVAFSAIEWGLGGQAYPLLRRVALARPYQPQVHLATAECLADLGHADLAVIYYEVALNGKWNARYQDFNRIAGVEYLHLLQRISAGELTTSAPEYAKARLESLSQTVDVDNADLIVTMMWNTDRTDVDLHVLEPSGEECFYKNRNTRAGGKITRDVTEGFGPEMYTLDKAQDGKYKIMANYFGTDTNRTQVRAKVYVTVYEMFGTDQERVNRHTVTLSRSKEKRDIASVTVDK